MIQIRLGRRLAMLLAALLLCLTLLCGCARADWADDTADALAMAICHGQAAGSPLRASLLQRNHKPEQVI